MIDVLKDVLFEVVEDEGDVVEGEFVGGGFGDDGGDVLSFVVLCCCGGGMGVIESCVDVVKVINLVCVYLEVNELINLVQMLLCCVEWLIEKNFMQFMCELVFDVMLEVVKIMGVDLNDFSNG